MCDKDLTSYDVKPKYMQEYIRHNGSHFNKDLCDFAVSRMYKKENGEEVPIVPYTKDEVEDLLKAHNIKLKNKNILYDHVYVANMCKADFLGESVPTEKHLALYVKNVIDDPDGYNGMPFTRWYADMCKKGIPIDWYDMI